MNGLSVDVIKSGYDCTNNGVSANHQRMVIYGDFVKNGPIDEDYKTDENAKLYIHKNPRDNTILMATISPDPDEMFQFGGNFVFSSDARFPSDQPIKIHDRVEDGTRRLSYEKIISITDPLHKIWKHFNDQQISQEAQDLISREISVIGKKYQDVLNQDQRHRVFVGVKN